MSKQINVADAKKWSKEEADFNLHYLDDRSMTMEAAAVREALGLDEGQFPASEGPAPAQAPNPESAPPETVDFQTMNVEETQKWVGEDPDRAQQVYDYENSKSEPRKTLVEWLEQNFEFEE